MAADEPPVVIIGAGLSGIACARMLAPVLPVVVLEAGERPGGRMAVRREVLGGAEHVVDVGASYLTVSDSDFAAVVEDWERRGLARRWADRFHVSEPGAVSRGEGLRLGEAGPMRWAARHGLGSLVEDLTAGLDVRCGEPVRRVEPVEAADGARPDRVAATVDGEPARAVVLAMPQPRAIRLVPPAVARELALGEVAWNSGLCVWAGWDERWWPELDGVFVTGARSIAWVADDGRRRGDGAPVLVVHTPHAYAGQHLDDPDRGLTPVLAELPQVLGVAARAVPEPRWARAHRWPQAHAEVPASAPYGLTGGNIGACGDGWGPRSRVEQAWLSGTALGRHLRARLT